MYLYWSVWGQKVLDDGLPSSGETSASSLLEKTRSDGRLSTRRLTYNLLTILNGVVFLVAILMLSMVIDWQHNIEAKCLQRHSWYYLVDQSTAPALKDIDPIYRSLVFNGSLDYPSIYRGDPSPEIDAAWDDIEHVHTMRISEDDILKIGKSTDAVKIPAEYGGGYLASLEVNHQLHCVNFLRKSLYRDYYSPPSPHASIEFIDHPLMIKTHQGHCVEMLRQLVMCHADVGVITHRFVKDYPRPYPDFNTGHQCRNFDSVLRWAKEKQWTAEKGGPPGDWKYVPGDGDVVLDEPP
ncbi:MAG: hypothetical protein Q9219_005169 [cf. Caloplaca sp. 3 TL-2023]